MPCSDGGFTQAQAEEFRDRADELARILCEVCEEIEAAPDMPADRLLLPGPLAVFWAQHRAEDEARRKLEEAADRKSKAARAALAKLTVEERQALGLELV